ncbi:MAG: glycosyltransferase family 2 protein [Candidatus Moranbacteria bacterium]|nr:glycosyltransferase family 2 protein [Candidatus Moranbacteria bacterium]
MNIRPKVIVVVLNKNGKDCLQDCLRGVFQSSYSNFEVVVVDNDSRDGSLEDAKSMFSRSHFILNRENLGFAAGMNVGIRYAFSQGARYVWVLNNDAVPGGDALSELVKTAEKHEDMAILSPLIFDPKGKVWFSGGKVDYFRMRARHVSSPGVRRANIPYGSAYLSGCALFLPKKALDRVGLFDEGYFLYYEDADFSIRARKAGIELLVVPNAVVVHAERSNMNPEKLYWLVRSGLLFFRKNTPKILRPWTTVYLFLRKMKNDHDRRRGGTESDLVARAYADSRKDA